MKNSYRKLICRRCRNQLQKSENPSRIELHKNAFACLFDSESSCCVASKDSDYLASVETSIDDDDDDDDNDKIKE